MNSGITSLAVGKSAQFKMQFKKSPSDSMSFLLQISADILKMSKTSPVGRCSVMCWPTSQSRSELGLPVALLYLLVKRYINMQTAVPVFSLHKSWHVNQKTMGFPVGRTFTPFYLSEFMDFSAESWHIIFLWLTATQRCGITQKDRLVVVLWWVLRFFISATI